LLAIAAHRTRLQWEEFCDDHDDSGSRTLRELAFDWNRAPRSDA